MQWTNPWSRPWSISREGGRGTRDSLDNPLQRRAEDPDRVCAARAGARVGLVGLARLDAGIRLARASATEDSIPFCAH
jgi:hypothetical protein